MFLFIPGVIMKIWARDQKGGGCQVQRGNLPFNLPVNLSEWFKCYGDHTS